MRNKVFLDDAWGRMTVTVLVQVQRHPAGRLIRGLLPPGLQVSHLDGLVPQQMLRGSPLPTFSYKKSELLQNGEGKLAIIHAVSKCLN